MPRRIYQRLLQINIPRESSPLEVAFKKVDVIRDICFLKVLLTVNHVLANPSECSDSNE